MKFIFWIAPLAIVLAASPASADPLDEILSLARRFGYLGSVAVERRPVPSYVAGDFQYQSSDEGYDSGYTAAPYGDRRNAWQYTVRISGVPATDELMMMNYRLLRSVARDSNADFDGWLSGIPAGEVWRKHFETRSIQDLTASDVNAVPTADEREAIVRILGIFDRAVETPDLGGLMRRDSARTLHAVLRELATPPEERLVRQLSVSARMLNRTLGAFSTGVTWQRYLALPDGVIAAADRPPGDPEARTDIDLAELSRMLERYDLVSRNQEYRTIVSLQEFQATHERLTELLNPPSAPPLPASMAEELPPPERQTR